MQPWMLHIQPRTIFNLSWCSVQPSSIRYQVLDSKECLYKTAEFQSPFLLLSNILWFLTNEILQKTGNVTKSQGKKLSFMEALRSILNFEVRGCSFLSYFLSLKTQEHMEDLQVGHSRAFKQI